MSDTDESPLKLLRQCVELGRIDVLRSLLSELTAQNNLVIIDSLDVYEETLLHLAVEAKNADAVRTILSAGANPCVPNRNGKTAVQLCDSPDIDSVFHQELLQAVAHSKMGRVCQLLACGIPIEIVDSPITRNSVLHWAASFGNNDIIKILCEGGANVNARNAALDTPLIDAVKRGDPEIVENLLKYGADPTLRNAKNEDAIGVARAKHPKIVDLLNQQFVHGAPMKRFASNDSLPSVNSLALENSNHSNGPISPTGSQTMEIKSSKNQNGNPFHLTVPADFLCPSGVEGRDPTDTLWPRPQKIRLLTNKPGLSVGVGATIRVLLPTGLTTHTEAAAILLKWEPLRSFLKARGFQLDLLNPLHSDAEFSVVTVRCAINESVLQQKEAYKLFVSGVQCDIIGTCEVGLQYGVITFVQLIAQHGTKVIPGMVIADWPDVRHRGIMLTSSMSRDFTTEAILNIAFYIFMLKGNLLILDYNLLPFNDAKDREKLVNTYRMLSIECQKLRISLGLSLDMVTLEDQMVVFDFVSLLEKLPKQTVIHCGPTVSAFISKSSLLRSFLRSSVDLVLLSGKPDEVANLDFGFTQCIPYSSVQDEDESISRCLSQLGSTCLTVEANMRGCLAVPPDELIVMSERLQHVCAEVTPMAVVCCDYAPREDLIVSNMQTFPYQTELVVLGKSWNCSEDGCCVMSALPLVMAQYRFGDYTMAPLFEQALIIGHIEHELAKAAKFRRVSLSDVEPPTIASVLNNLLKDPNSVALDSLSAIIFKRVRMELSKCQLRLTTLKTEMPYNFEMALSLGEVQLMLNLTIWAARLGQSLCQIGTNPKSTSGSHVVNVGVSNLSHTTKTDLANKLIELKGNFHHIWLSRNDQSTLTEAVKMFDNLLAVLLPQNLTRYQHAS